MHFEAELESCCYARSGKMPQGSLKAATKILVHFLSGLQVGRAESNYARVQGAALYSLLCL